MNPFRKRLIFRLADRPLKGGRVKGFSMDPSTESLLKSSYVNKRICIMPPYPPRTVIVRLETPPITWVADVWMAFTWLLERIWGLSKPSKERL